MNRQSSGADSGSFAAIIYPARRLARHRQRHPMSVQRRLDATDGRRDNGYMEIQGVFHDGVVVLQDSVTLPEGAAVTVTYRPAPLIRVAEHPKPVILPLFDSDEPGTIDLTNESIAEILDREDASS
jgi:hypothetical protein